MERTRLRSTTTQQVLALAKRKLGSLRPKTDVRLTDQADPWADAELSIEDTVDRDPRGGKPVLRERVIRYPRAVLCLDTSQSMTGAKMTVLGTACAMFALNTVSERYAAVAFENTSTVLKRMKQRLGPVSVIERLLDMPYKGYTHLEDGLLAAQKEQERGAAIVLITDGKFTAGRDPRFIASRLAPLHVVLVGGDESGLRFCRELASLGMGFFYRAQVLASLPLVMYGLLRNLNRRSHHER